MPILRIDLRQGWAISGPRATCGPPQRFQWPAEAFRKNDSSLKFPPASLLFLLEERFLIWNGEVSLVYANTVFQCNDMFNLSVSFNTSVQIVKSGRLQWICFSKQLVCCVYRKLLRTIYSIRVTNSKTICCKIWLAVYASELATWRADTSFVVRPMLYMNLLVLSSTILHVYCRYQRWSKPQVVYCLCQLTHLVVLVLKQL